MTIEPDAKDWTWVLSTPCPECGWDPAEHPAEQVAADLRSNTARWPELLAATDARRRPRPDRWSALEYGCHVRDVHALALVRFGRMLAEDDPRFDNWDQDETAVADRYDEQDPSVVASELVAAGEAVADLLDGLDPPAWDRPGRRSDGAHFTVASFARYLLHDPVHHVHDVELGQRLSAADEPPQPA